MADILTNARAQGSSYAGVGVFVTSGDDAAADDEALFWNLFAETVTP